MDIMHAAIYLAVSLWLAIGLIVVLLIVIELSMKHIIFKLPFFIKQQASIIDDTLMAPHPKIPESYTGCDWIQSYIGEAQKVFKTVRWSPFRYWRSGQFVGEHININSRGFRKTWSSPKSDKAEITVHVYGGSVAWGWGARDAYTIPSIIAKDLLAHGVNARVYNCAELGYVSTQGVISLIKEIQRDNAPQILISIDGLNDVFTTFQAKRTGVSQNEENRAREFNQTLSCKLSSSVKNAAMFRFLDSIRECSSNRDQIEKITNISDKNNLAERCADTYLSNLRIFSNLISGSGGSSLFYWQPTLFDKKILSTFEESMYVKQQFWETFYNTVHQTLMDKDALSNYHDISDIFNSMSSTVYIDPWHVDELGYKMIANKISSDVMACIS